MRFARTAALAAALSLSAGTVAFAGSIPSCPTGSGIMGNTKTSMKLEVGGLATFCNGGVTVKMGYVFATPKGPAYGSFAQSGANRYDDTVIVGAEDITFIHVSGHTATVKK